MTVFYYFGCIGQSGHYLWTNPHRSTYDFDCLPWRTKVDGKLCPLGDPWKKGGQVQGAAALHHFMGWTALAFWDRTVDSRPGSNSVFLADEVLPFERMVELAKEKFPAVWSRFTFEVVPA